MPFPETKFNSYLFSLLLLIVASKSAAQTFNWDVCDWDGNKKFSVSADTVFSITKGVYNVRIGEEDILIKENPFQPILRTSKLRFVPFTEDFFASTEDNVKRLFSTRNVNMVPLHFQFRKLFLWQGHIIGTTDLKCIFQPGSDNEIIADSFRLEKKRMLLFRNNEIVEIDLKNKTSFFRTSGIKRDLNTYSSYVLNDSIWLPVSGIGKELKWFPNGIWWNDTTYIDSNATNVYIQTPQKPRQRLSDSIVIVSGEFICVFRKGAAQILSSKGIATKIPKPKELRALNDSLCAVKTQSRWNIVSSHGNRYPVSKTITELYFLEDGMMMAKAGNRFGFLDGMGFIRISCRYDSLFPFQNGLSAARLGKVWGFLDKNEKLFIQPHYQCVKSFIAPLTEVKKDEKWGLLAVSGDLVQPCIFDSLGKGKHLGWKAFKSKWAGWLNNDGKILLPNRYTDIIEPCSGFLQVLRDGRTGLFTSKGASVFPLIYTRICPEITTHTIIAR
jgi:hypothetical protein